MKTLNISQLRDHLPEIIDGVVQSNEPVVITRYGRPVARIQPFRGEQHRDQLYPLRGTPITVADDFDEPMPELWNALMASEAESDYSKSRRPARKAKRRS